MLRYIAIIFCCFIGFLNSSNGQDTIWVQTLTWDSTVRRGVWEFPDDPSQSYRKILMYYNMRCHGARVGNGNVGCYEWDYSCNTFITDSSKTDSSVAFQNNYTIRGFNDAVFNYSLDPSYTYYQYVQKKARFNSVSGERKYQISGPVSPFAFDARAGCYRGQFLYSAVELQALGLRAGNIAALEIPVSAAGSSLPHFRIRLKHWNQTQANPLSPVLDSLQEVYYLDTEFNAVGSNRFQFHTPFKWDGASAILVDISFSKFDKAAEPQFSWQEMPSLVPGIQTSGIEKSIVFDGISAQLKNGKLNQLQNEITVAFWSYGTAHLQPTNGSIIEGFGPNKDRALNIHLPWSNGGIYFDCGNEAGGYDRVEKQGVRTDYESQWVHWAFTKNTQTGRMSIYKNGSLYVTGINKSKKMDIVELNLGEALGYDGPYYGRVREMSVWSKELDSTTIKDWIHRSLTPAHPQYNALVYYFDMQKNSSNQIMDEAPNPQNAILKYPLERHQERGDKLIMNFETLQRRPAFSFITGNYTGFTVEDFPVRDSIIKGPSWIRQYSVINNSLNLDSSYYLYQSGDENVYLENGDIADVIYIEPQGHLLINRLKYFRKLIAKYELLSLVTPYGNGLDLGPDGKTFIFDVTDFTPILKGKKLLSMELGGENQEEINIRFAFIKGIPERQVLDISNIWPFDRGYFSEITGNQKFEPRELNLRTDASEFELRLSITGHEQNGEFTNKKHFITASGNGNRKYQFDVWKECADNPIYPQGGTWIFDRAGWCPGAPTELHRFNITPQVSSGKVTLDYGVELPALTAANYLVSSQIVSYGPYTLKNDAALEAILRPSQGRVEFDRLNPSCSNPMIRIRNSGSEILTSLKIIFGRKGSKTYTFNWNGNLNPSGELDINIPVPEENFLGQESSGIFEVVLLEPNGKTDENSSNNSMSTSYKLVEKFGTNLHLEFKTNGVPADSRYKIVNWKGETVIQRNSMTGNTIYRDELNLSPGCYTIIVDDLSHDGLYFWFNSTLGSGFARLSKKVNNSYAILRNFNPDFGSGFQYDFIIDPQVAVKDLWIPKFLSITPNPSDGPIRIEVLGDESGVLNLEVLDMSGKIILSKDLNHHADGQIHSLKLDNLESGIYLIRFFQNGKQYVRKIQIF